MKSVGIWQIAEQRPQRLTGGRVELEKHLEEWIEKDPGLLEAGLTIVGRQIHCEAGPLDLLAVDPQGRWVIIEIKRGQLRREVLAQALDYAACVSAMSAEQLHEKALGYLAKRHSGNAPDYADLLQTDLPAGEADAGDREIIVYLVGTGRDAGLSRLVDYVGQNSRFDIRVVTFDVFQLVSGEQVMVRELKETDVPPPTATRRSGAKVDDVLGQADAHRVGKSFRTIHQAAVTSGLYARPYRQSIMYTPGTNHSRCLVTLWTKSGSDGKLKVWVSNDNIPEFYDISQDQVVKSLGFDGEKKLTPAEAEAFAVNLATLFQK